MKTPEIPAALKPRRWYHRLNQETFWIVILVLGCLFRAWHVVFYLGPMDHIFSDSGRHLENGRFFMKPGPLGCSNAYFYQLFLYVVVTLTKETRPWIDLVNATLSVLYPYLWYRFARTVMTRRVNALRFAVVLALLPTHSVIFQYFMTETLVLPLTGAALWVSVVAVKRRSAWRYLLAVLLWTCALLTRIPTIPLAALVLGYALYHQRKRPFLWRPAIGLVGASFTAVGLYIAAQHSLRILEYPTLFGDSKTGSLSMMSGAKVVQMTYKKPRHYSYTYAFSSPSLYISPFEPFYDWRSIRKGTFKYTINIDAKGKDLQKLYVEQFEKNKHLLPRFFYENLVFLTFGHSWPEAGTHSNVGKICLRERWIWFPILLTSMIASFVFMVRRRKLYFVPVVAIFSTAALYGAQMVVMEGRYRKPIEPLLILAIFWLLDARWPRRSR